MTPPLAAIPSRMKRNPILILIAIAAATAIAYFPAATGGFIWDDDAHVTRHELRSLEGLGRIWFEVGATQQYYPLMHSAFWVQHHLWGERTTGYHAVNIALHAMNAMLVMLIVRRLLRGQGAAWADSAAALAAAVFALHPVHVESVAWITELKNTLSGAFYLLAVLVYLRFDESRRRRLYLLAAALFAMGLLTKTIVATLPAALLVIVWWQRGRLSWKKDALPLLPWFVLGAVSGLFTAWVEHEVIGAKGQAFDLSIVQRMMLSGRVVCFYLSKLIWPTDLIFIYPRWTIDPASPLQWTYPVALAIVVIGLLAWTIRGRREGSGRGPLAAMLFFVGSLFPVLGFFNVYPFLFSYVADHFQYLPSLGVIALACGAIAATVSRVPVRAARIALLTALPLFLGVLTFRQAHMYADVETLYETTIRRNPACWMAHNNLGVALKSRGRLDDAARHYRRALALRPDYPEAHNNLGLALHATGNPRGAVDSYREALRLRPANPEALGNLGASLTSLGRAGEAVAAFQQALQFDPDDAGLRFNLGVALHAAARLDDAIGEYRRALALDPSLPGVHAGLGRALAGARPQGEAIAAYLELLRADPEDSESHFAVAVLLADAGRLPEAIEHYAAVVRLRPTHIEAHNNFGSLLSRSGRPNEAIPHFEEAARLLPSHVGVRMNLAGAYSAAGRFDDAIAAAEHARDAARSSGDAASAEKIDVWINECRARAVAPRN